MTDQPPVNDLARLIAACETARFAYASTQETSAYYAIQTADKALAEWMIANKSAVSQIDYTDGITHVRIPAQSGRYDRLTHAISGSEQPILLSDLLKEKTDNDR